MLAKPRTVAEISDLNRPENGLDRRIGNKLVEVYRPVWTPSGTEALFEIYTPYDEVSQRTGQLWRGFAGVTLSSLLLFVVLLAPLLWHLLRRVRRAQRQRELLLERAVDASATERRRIAATLHDGPVQDLAATSFVIAGAAAQARATGQTAVVDELGAVSASVRTSIRALRSLLVDIYPASLAQAGLGAALADLAQSVRAQGLEVQHRHRRRPRSRAGPGTPGLPGGPGDAAQRGQARGAVHGDDHALPCAGGGRRGRARRGRRRQRVRRGGAGRPPGAGALRPAAPGRRRDDRGSAAPGRLGTRSRYTLAAPGTCRGEEAR